MYDNSIELYHALEIVSTNIVHVKSKESNNLSLLFDLKANGTLLKEWLSRLFGDIMWLY